MQTLQRSRSGGPAQSRPPLRWDGGEEKRDSTGHSGPEGQFAPPAALPFAHPQPGGAAEARSVAPGALGVALTPSVGLCPRQ